MAKLRTDDARAAALNAGLVAAAIYNVNRKKGAPAFEAQDFVSMGEADFMTPAQAQAHMDGWARSRGSAALSLEEIDAARGKMNT